MDGDFERDLLRGSNDEEDDPIVLPRCVEDAMADIATVFGWTVEYMDKLDVPELMAWRERARVRVEVREVDKKQD